jgi:uncharacterized protein (DUF58 family)
MRSPFRLSEDMRVEPEFQENRAPTIFNSPLICFFVGLLLFVALLYRQNDLSLLAILVLVVMSAAKAWSSVSLSRITCTFRVDKQRVFPGETLSLQTIVENAKFLPIWIRMRWPSKDALVAIDSDEGPSWQGTGLLWHQRVQFNQKLTAIRRGLHHVGPPYIQSSDLFGFFKKEKKLADTVCVIVYPRLVAVKTVSLPKRDLFGTFGAKSPVKDPVYILGTRDYQPSGPSRHIHWKASARHLRLQEKLFEPSAQGKILIALEVGMYEKNKAEDAFEHTLEIIASLSVRLNDMGLAVGFITNGASPGGNFSAIAPGRNPRQLTDILEALARLQMRQKRPMQDIVRLIPGSRRGLSCAYFSYEDGETTVQMKKYCGNHNIPVAMFVCRPNPESDALQQADMAGVHLMDEISIQESHPV